MIVPVQMLGGLEPHIAIPAKAMIIIRLLMLLQRCASLEFPSAREAVIMLRRFLVVRNQRIIRRKHARAWDAKVMRTTIHVVILKVVRRRKGFVAFQTIMMIGSITTMLPNSVGTAERPRAYNAFKFRGHDGVCKCN